MALMELKIVVNVVGENIDRDEIQEAIQEYCFTYCDVENVFFCDGTTKVFDEKLGKMVEQKQ